MTKHFVYPSGVISTENVDTIEERTDGSVTLVCFDNTRHTMAPGWLSVHDGDELPEDLTAPPVAEPMVTPVAAPLFEHPAAPVIEPVVPLEPSP